MAMTAAAWERKKSNWGKTFISSRFLIMVCFTVILALAYVHIKVEGVKLGYDISANKRKEETMLKKNLILKAEFMELKSPGRIEAMVRDLGFKFPTQEDVIYVEEKTVVGERR